MRYALIVLGGIHALSVGLIYELVTFSLLAFVLTLMSLVAFILLFFMDTSGFNFLNEKGFVIYKIIVHVTFVLLSIAVIVDRTNIVVVFAEFTFIEKGTITFWIISFVVLTIYIYKYLLFDDRIPIKPVRIIQSENENPYVIPVVVETNGNNVEENDSCNYLTDKNVYNIKINYD